MEQAVDRNSFIYNFKRNIVNRAPKAFLLFIVLVLIIECGIQLLSPGLAANSAYLGIRGRVLVAQTEDVNRDILIFGDSTAGVGINPQRLHQETELPCANLATQAGTTIAANYFLLQDYLKFNDPPQQIILMRMFNGWSGTPNKRTNELLLSNFPEKMFELIMHPRLIGNNYGTILRAMLGYLLPSQRNRGAIRKIARKVIGMEKTIPEVITESQQKITEWKQRILGEIPYNMGREGTAEQREQNLLKKMNFVSNNTFHASERSTCYLEQLITLAEQNKITVFISLPPVRKEIYEDEAGKEYLQSSKEFIEDVCSSHDNVVLLTDDFHFCYR